MNKLKDKFNNDPAFACAVMVSAAIVATGLIKASAKVIEASAYAYRASKL